MTHKLIKIRKQINRMAIKPIPLDDYEFNESEGNDEIFQKQKYVEISEEGTR